MAVLFVGAVFVLGVKLLRPASIQVFVEGSESAVSVIPGFFTFTDVSLIATSSVILGASAIYLMLYTPMQEMQIKKSDTELKHSLKNLKDDERIVYEFILEGKGIVFQSEIVTKTGFPKVKVSRCLDALENRDLVERHRKGMSNIVVLK
jgi:uncharacterized membrane protein